MFWWIKVAGSECSSPAAHHVVPIFGTQIFESQKLHNPALDKTKDKSNPILQKKKQDKIQKMKVLTLNFLTCAVKTCKSSSDSFPLHPKDAELAKDDVEINPQLLVNVLPRIDWRALRTTSTEVCIS